VIAPEPAGECAPQVLQPRWATVHALLLDALARDRLGHRQTADASIERALALAEPDGIMLPFVVTPVRELLERHRGHRAAHAALLSTILDVLASASPPADVPPLLEPLSDAELRVLGYLPSNLRSSEIAAELFVSSNTVRTHLRHIYAKLDAHTRTEAVARARRLGCSRPGASPATRTPNHAERVMTSRPTVTEAHQRQRNDADRQIRRFGKEIRRVRQERARQDQGDARGRQAGGRQARRPDRARGREGRALSPRGPGAGAQGRHQGPLTLSIAVGRAITQKV
jgi:DNA-binding CsgD family transcriptional regulator